MILSTMVRIFWWKTGPVDLMWDDERQVWAGGLSFVEGELIKSIEPARDITDPDTSGEALIYRRKYNRGDGKYEWTIKVQWYH